MHINRNSKGDSATRFAKWDQAHAGQQREIRIIDPESGIAVKTYEDRFVRGEAAGVDLKALRYRPNGKREVARRLRRVNRA